MRQTRFLPQKSERKDCPHIIGFGSRSGWLDWSRAGGAWWLGRVFFLWFLLVTEAEDYPTANGYTLLVTQSDVTPNTLPGVRALLESVVVSAVDAEWAVYKKLPKMDVISLDGVFDSEGSAYKQIYDLAERQ